MGQPTSGSFNKRNVFIGVSVAVAAALLVSHYTLDFPGGGSSLSGTVAPAQRYRTPQTQAQDVKLGDQSIAQVMQSDAFDRLIKDPQVRALAQDASFKALAANPEAFKMMAAHPEAFAAMAARPEAFAVMAANPEAFAVMAANPEAFRSAQANPEAFRALFASPEAFAAVKANP